MRRTLAILTALAVVATVFATTPVAAGGVECDVSAAAGDVSNAAVGVSAATSSVGGQGALQIAVSNNVQAGNVAIDFGSGDATTIVQSVQRIDQDVDQEICED